MGREQRSREAREETRKRLQADIVVGNPTRPSTKEEMALGQEATRSLLEGIDVELAAVVASLPPGAPQRDAITEVRARLREIAHALDLAWASGVANASEGRA